MCPGVVDYADSESAFRIEKGCTVTEIRSPEILPVKFSRTALSTYLGVVLGPNAESVVRIQISCSVSEIGTF